MSKVLELKKKRAALIDDAKAIQRAAEIQSRELNEGEFGTIEQKMQEARGLDAEIQAAERQQGVLAELGAEHEKLAQIEQPRSGAKAGPVGPYVSVRPRWEDDPCKGFSKERDFYMAVLRAGSNPSASIPENLQYLKAKPEHARLMATAGSDEQSTFSDPYGGFLIPEGHSPNLLTVPTDEDPLAGRTTQIPMDTLSIKIDARTDKDHTTSVSGGLQVYRRAESQEVAASRMQFEQVVLDATSLMGVSYQTDELLRYSPRSVAALVAAGFGDEFRSRLIRERIRGTGVGEYMGIVTSPALITVTKEPSQDADTITGQNIVDMRSRCWGYKNSIWMANLDCYPQMTGVHIAGTNGDVFLFNPARGEDVPDMLLGRPIFFGEDTATIGDAGDLMLVNPTQYLEGTLQPLEGAESIHVRFLANEKTFRFTTMNAGAPWWRSALTPKRSTKTLSPFVILEART